MNIDTLFVGWQHPDTRAWHTIGKITSDIDNALYEFIYTNGVKGCEGAFQGFPSMNDFSQTYYSESPFPFMQNRLLPKNRPERSDFLKWLGTSEEEVTPLLELAYSGGIKGTDNIEFFSYPKKKNNQYVFKYFIRGIRHLSKCSIERITNLSEGEPLFITTDPQNKHDSSAILLRADNPAMLVGYCPRYIAWDICNFIKSGFSVEKWSAKVSRVNMTAPLQFRLAIEMKVELPAEYKPLSNPELEQYVNNNINAGNMAQNALSF